MIVVTGATGKLGRHVLQSLLKKVPATRIVAAVRDPAKATDLAALGITIRQADYEKPETLAAAFAGAEKVLLISSNDLEHRTPQHKSVIDAAVHAGVKLVAYTSLLDAATSPLQLAADHQATESYLRHSGLAFSFLRNGWYLENHTENLGPALAHGAIVGAAGEGRFSAAARADYADAAATVLAEDGHDNTIYELAGDSSYSLSELAAEVTRQSGKSVSYQDMPEAAYAGLLASFGLPPALAAALADADHHAAQGALENTARTLSQLTGHPTRTLAEAVRAALAA